MAEFTARVLVGEAIEGISNETKKPYKFHNVVDLSTMKSTALFMNLTPSPDPQVLVLDVDLGNLKFPKFVSLTPAK